MRSNAVVGCPTLSLSPPRSGDRNRLTIVTVHEWSPLPRVTGGRIGSNSEPVLRRNLNRIGGRIVEKSCLFAIRSVPSHGRGKQLADGCKPLFGRRGTLGIGHHRWLRSGVWKQQTRFQDTNAGEGADCPFSGEIEGCRQNEVGQILSHLIMSCSCNRRGVRLFVRKTHH